MRRVTLLGNEVFVRFRYYARSSDKREFYSSRKEGGDYLSYVDTGSKDGEFKDYLDYAGNKEKSSGAFGPKGLLSDTEKKEIRKMLRNTGSCIWDCIISTEEFFGKEKLNGIEEDNVTWFAGLHENTDNRHIHLCFFQNRQQKWEQKEGKKRHSGTHWHKPKLLQPSFEQFRFACLNFLVEREKYQSLIDMRGIRDEMTKARFEDEPSDKRIRRALYDVFRELPEHGLKGIRYMSKELNPETRLAVNLAVDEIIERTPKLRKRYDAIYTRLSERDNRIRRGC